MKVHFYTVVWGDWHTDILLDVNLPSLLAPGNMPAFVDQHDVTFTIFTTEADAQRINRSRIFPAFGARVPTCLEAMQDRYFFGDTIDDFVNNHHRLWSRGLRACRREGSMAGLLAPDLCWADGSFRHLADLVSAGKRAIFSAQMRVCDDSFIADGLPAWTDGVDGSIAIPPRELVKLLCANMHPIIASYLQGSPAPCFHYEHLIWPVSGEGMLVRNLTCHGFLTSPARFDLNDMHCPETPGSDDEIAFPTDSDDMFCVSLTPAMKDVSWYFSGQPFDTFDVAGWWGSFDNPIHRQLAKQDWHFHFSDRVDSSEWERARGHASQVCDRLIATDRLFRVWRILKAHGRTKAAQFLSAFLQEGDEFYFPDLPTEDAVILVPREEELELIPDWYVGSVISKKEVGTARNLLDGILTTLANPDSRDVEAGAELMTPQGTIVAVESWKGESRIGEMVIKAMDRTAAGDVVCFVDRLGDDGNLAAAVVERDDRRQDRAD